MHTRDLDGTDRSGLRKLGWLGASAVIGGAALTLAWILLCGLPWRGYTASLVHSTGIASARGLLLLAVGGWVVGVPGLLGHGPIRVGWLTLAATPVLTAATLWSLLRRTAAEVFTEPETGDAEPEQRAESG